MSDNVSIQDCIDMGERWFIEAGLFFGHGTDNAADEALWLVFFQLQLPWDSPESILAQRVEESDYQAIISLFRRRIDERVPAAYLTEEAWFCGLPFKVNEHVLVPRSPLAECIQSGFSPWLDALYEQGIAPRILDLCTGSGCIGIATALVLPEAHLVLSDISRDALSVAEANCQRHQVSDRVSCVESDLFGALAGQRFDLIVSNPPYVDAEDFASRPPEYQAEPDIALASGDDGLDFTRRLLSEAAVHLNQGGHIIIELGNSGRYLEAAFPEVPFLWLEFEYGGHGVFVLSRDELLVHF